MPDSFKQFGLRMMSGEDRSLLVGIARTATTLVEPFYRASMSIRNTLYDCDVFKSHSLNRPTISVGNITTGGTGKTPVVAWLADALRSRGRHPAILLRGYGAGQFSDEATVLDENLNSIGKNPIRVYANPSRITGAQKALLQNPKIDTFVLDDAFQHRKVRRDFNLVLISATLPFGYGHVLPRGLLRESLSGLKRADAFLITRCSLVNPSEIERIEGHLRRYNPAIPIFRCDHQLAGFSIPTTGETVRCENQRVFLTAGIGDPQSFARQISDLKFEIVGQHWFSDHHRFTESDMVHLQTLAQTAGASFILTTEKDWVKMKNVLPAANRVGIAVTQLQIAFRGDDQAALLELIFQSLDQHPKV